MKKLDIAQVVPSRTRPRRKGQKRQRRERGWISAGRSAVCVADGPQVTRPRQEEERAKRSVTARRGRPLATPDYAGPLHADLGDTPAAQPVREGQQFPAGGAEGPCLLLAAAGAGVAGDPDGDFDLSLGDIQAGDPFGEQRLVFDILHR
jgi:hypothetical protein